MLPSNQNHQLRYQNKTYRFWNSYEIHVTHNEIKALGFFKIKH